jgi:outer membrane protein
MKITSLTAAVRGWRRAALALALAATGGAQAQSLQELYEIARGYDATYLAARATAEAAEYRAAAAEGLALPTLTANARGVATQIELPKGGEGDNNALQTSLNGRYPLFNRANDATIAQAKQVLLASRAELESAEQDLIIRVAQAYFDVLAATDTAKLTRVSMAAIQEQLASAKRNFEVGTATITDTREAQARADLASAQEIAADIDLRNKRIALGTLVGRRDIEPYPLAAPVVLPPVLPNNVDDWVNSAEAGHPQVLRSKAALDIAQLEIDKAKAGELPTVDAIASLGANYAAGVSKAIVPGTTRIGSVGVELNWPLYTGGSVQNRIKETVSLQERSRNEYDSVRRTVAQNTRVAFFSVRSGEALVRALEAAEASSKLSLEATQLGYKVGVRVNIDVLNAQTQLFQTQRDLFKSRYDVLVGGLRLRQASGLLTPTDVATVSRMTARPAS